jgi:acetyl esterase/lipase
MRITFLSLALTLAASLSAQCGGRYVWEIFSDVNKTPDIPYGANLDYEGNPVDLHVDFFEPAGDALAARPLVILAHGGFFISGDRTAADIVGICEGLARRGYACASLQYRLGVGLTEIDSAGFAKAVVRGVQDAKAAVRFFRAQAEAYGIDTAQIFLGGTSAGGVLAVHYAYLQDTALSEPWINALIADLGGLEGNSGNPGYPTHIKGAVSYAGAFKNINWIGPKPVPLASTHGTEDDVVPYGYGYVTYVLVPGLIELPITTMYGSAALHPELDARGIVNEFLSFEGAGHVPHIQPGTFGLDPVIFPQTLQWTAEFLHRQLACYDPTAGVAPVMEAPAMLHSWPNPADQVVWLEGFPDQGELHFMLGDASGRILRQWTDAGHTMQRIDRGDLPAGLYWIQARTSSGIPYRAVLTFQ